MITEIPQMQCRLCGSANVVAIYNGPARHSGLESDASEKLHVHRCSDCKVAYHDDVDSRLTESYASGVYWDAKGAVSVSKLNRQFEKSLEESTLWLNQLGVESFMSKTVLDFGCGPGGFLCSVREIAKQVVGVEVDKRLADRAQSESGAVIYLELDHVPRDLKYDTVVSFDVFEHLNDPVDYLLRLSDLLSPDGEIIVGVPNFYDVIKEVEPEYLRHFFHHEHIWYFCRDSLDYVAQKSGFLVSNFGYLHKYNFINFVNWLSVGEPTGNARDAIFLGDLDVYFKNTLERLGKSSHVFVRYKKK